jgi:ankyrin repeat protein
MPPLPRRALLLPTLLFPLASPAATPSPGTPAAATSLAAHGTEFDAAFARMEKHECGWHDLAFADFLRSHPDFAAARNARGETPLHVAARRGYEHEAFLLLRAGAEVNARDAAGRTPLHHAARQRHEDAWMIRDMLVIRKADIDARDSEGFTPLMHAAQRGNARTVEALVWLGASLRAPDSGGLSPRALALAAGHADLAPLLDENPAEERVTLLSPHRQIPPHVARAFTDAAAKKDYALLAELIAEGVDINTQDASGATALHRAVYRAHEDVVTFLLMLGADPALVDGRGNTPFMAASGWFGRSMDWMRAMLLLAGGPVHGPINKSGFSPLGLAVHHGNEEPAQLLIWCGADPAGSTGERGTPMRIASLAGSQRLIDLLHRNGVTEPAFVDPVPQRRLEQYVKRGLLPEVRALVADGEVNLSALTDSGRTLAVEAVHSRNIEMVELLLELGADPEQPCRDGGNLLHATTAWDYGTVNAFRQRLLDRKIQLEVADKNGLTALMKAARHGADWEGLRQLVAAGARLDARDAKGRTALDLALQSGRGDATRYLLSVGAPHSDPASVDPGL